MASPLHAPTRRPLQRRLLDGGLGTGETERQRSVGLDAGSGLRLRLEKPAIIRRRCQQQARSHHALRKVGPELCASRFIDHSTWFSEIKKKVAVAAALNIAVQLVSTSVEHSNEEERNFLSN